MRRKEIKGLAVHRFIYAQCDGFEPKDVHGKIEEEEIGMRIPDLARGSVWPGAMSRGQRNAFIERWAGREWELRACQPEALASLQKATADGDARDASLFMGQDAGLIRDIPTAVELIERIVAEAEVLMKDRLPTLVSALPSPSAL